MTDWAKIRLLEARQRWWRAKYDFRKQKFDGYSDDVHRSEQMNHPEARKKAEALRGKWAQLMGEAAKEVHRYATALAALKPTPPSVPQDEGYSVPKTVWNPYRRTIANWVARELAWAHEHGWNGVVTSGLRTYAEQKVLYERYLHGGNIAAKPGLSNHEGFEFPKGAIDTPQAKQLDEVLRKRSNRKLLWAETHGLSDFVHFSGTGR